MCSHPQYGHGYKWAGLAALILLGFTSAARQLPMRVYRTSQGLPRNTVTCMVPGRNGVMWFCTTEGLVRFDGQTFRVFGPAQGIPSRIVFSIVPSRTGGYWVTTDRGLCRLRAEMKTGDPCRPLTMPNSEAWDGGSVVESDQGDIWAASGKRVYRVRPESGTLEDLGLRNPNWVDVLSLGAEPGGRLLVGTDDGLYEWNPGSGFRTITEGLPHLGVAAIVRHTSGDFWLASAGGLYRLRFAGPGRRPELVGGWTKYPEVPARLLFRRDGTLWATTSNASLLQVIIDGAGNATVSKRLGHEDGLPAVVLQRLAEDAGGRLWVSTEGEGVVRIEDNGFVTYGTADGLGPPRIASTFEDRDGRLCVMTSWDGTAALRFWTGNRFQAAAVPYPKELQHYGAGWGQWGLQARDGEWWIPTATGLLRFAPAKAENLATARLKNWYRPGAGLGCLDVFRTFEDSRGNIWVSCEDAPYVAMWNRRTEQFQTWTTADGWNVQVSPTVFREISPETMWLGSTSGMYRFRGGRFERMSQAPAVFIRDVFRDREGRVWIATPGKGLFRCDRPDVERPLLVNYTVDEGLSSNYLRAVTQDRYGFIYVSSVRGVDRIDPRAPLEPRLIRHFTAEDGLPDNEHNTAYAAHDGHLWFGTLGGLAEFDPDQAPQLPAPEVYFTRVTVRGEEVPLSWDVTRTATIELAHDRNQAEISFVAPNSYSPAELRYQYHLSGVDKQWSAPGTDLRVNYPALPTGHLQFEVRAVNAEGKISARPAILNLIVDAPFWRRGWFVALCSLCMGFLAAVGYRYRVNHLLALERLRTHIATDLHDDIGANLSQIAILSELARREPGGRSLEAIPEIARETVEQMSDIVWAVNPRHDRLDALVYRMRRFAGEALGASGMELRFESEKLPADFTVPIQARRPLYLVFKEAIHNAAQHSGASCVTVRIELLQGVLHLEVADNGRGFDASAPGDGEGLASIARRVRDLGGTSEWDTAPGKGTRLFVALPLGRLKAHLN